MSEDQAVQIARQGEALVDEHEYRRAYQQMLKAIDVCQELRTRLIKAWFAEYYPGLDVIAKPSEAKMPDGAISTGIDITIDNPSAYSLTVSAVNQEVIAYLTSLEA